MNGAVSELYQGEKRQCDFHNFLCLRRGLCNQRRYAKPSPNTMTAWSNSSKAQAPARSLVVDSLPQSQQQLGSAWGASLIRPLLPILFANLCSCKDTWYGPRLGVSCWHRGLEEILRECTWIQSIQADLCGCFHHDHPVFGRHMLLC